MQVKFKWVVLAAATLTMALLAACGQSKFNTSAYNYVYTDDPVTFDYTTTYRTSDSDHLSNFIDGLFERCQYGRLKPDIAKTWSVSDDGLTYTYKLRKGVKWADAQGKTYATVKAQDFVTGLKHAVRAKSETLYVVQDSIKGLADYVNGKTTDFNTVGVKALDDYTLQYTLNQPESYWNSKLTYGVMYPVSAKFLAEKQENFGRVSRNGILYNGPYVLAKYKRKGVIQYKANPQYRDKKNVHIKRVTQTYNNGVHSDNLYKQFREGKLSTVSLDPTTREFADIEKKEKDNIIWSPPDSAVFNFTFNLDRRSYNLTSKTTEKAKTDTHKAIMNQDFRLAIQAAFDKTKYNAEKSSKEGGALSLRNMVTPYQFVQIDGHSYGEKVGKLLSRLNPALFEGVDLRDQQDGTYNPVTARQLMARAKATLKKQGVSFPIHLDTPGDQEYPLIMNQNKTFKAGIERVLGKQNVVIDVQDVDEDTYNDATYQAQTGASADYDIAHATGWGPDYDDPSAYLDIYNSKDGAFLKNLGLDQVVPGRVDATAAVKKQLKLAEYDHLLAAAKAINNNDNARYTAFAQAEAWLLNTGIQIPTNSTGAVPSLTHSYQMAQPLTRPYVQSGLGDKRFKYVKMQQDVITAAEYDRVKAKWDKKRRQLAKIQGQQADGQQ